jgi:hypothetical protein
MLIALPISKPDGNSALQLSQTAGTLTEFSNIIYMANIVIEQLELGI